MSIISICIDSGGTREAALLKVFITYTIIEKVVFYVRKEILIFFFVRLGTLLHQVILCQNENGLTIVDGA